MDDKSMAVLFLILGILAVQNLMIYKEVKK